MMCEKCHFATQAFILANRLVIFWILHVLISYAYYIFLHRHVKLNTLLYYDLSKPSLYSCALQLC